MTLSGQVNLMRNRAKCLLCKSIIESFHLSDYVSCKCGHISVSEGPGMCCGAIDFTNFIRVDDEGNEIFVKEVTGKPETPKKITDIKEMIDELYRLIDSVENIPKAALSEPVSHYELYSSLLLIAAILRKIVSPSS